MSWLSNLAKQGEAFLDNLDQQAGSAIENVEKKVKEKVKETRTTTTTPGDNAMDRGATHHRSLQVATWRICNMLHVICIG